MLLYVIFGVLIGLLSVLSLLAARTATGAAARLEESVAQLRRAVDRQSLELQTAIRSQADAQQQEFSRVRALIEVVPHSVAALKPELAQIRASLSPPKPAFEDPVPYIEAMPEADVLRIAAALAVVRPLTPYPNWYFDADWQNPDLGYRIRRSIWTYFSRRKKPAAIDIPWYGALKMRIYLGNDLSRQQYVAGCLDPNEFALLDKLLAPGMVFIDAGANEGFYTVFASYRVGKTGVVWAFEPSKREMERLTTNVGLNSLANVRTFGVGLADEDTDAELLIAGDEHSGHNTLGQFVYESELSKRESVPLRRLDNLVRENALKRLDFLKIDVEGAEWRVLAGALGALRLFRPMILLEVSDASLKAQGSSRGELIQLLESQAYRLYLFDACTGLPVPAFEGRYGANMLAVPVERNLPETALSALPRIRT